MFEIIQSTFSHYKGIKLELNSKKVLKKSGNTWKLNNIFQNNPWIKKKSKT